MTSWHQPVAMTNGAPGVGEHSAGTDYTLQGTLAASDTLSSLQTAVRHVAMDTDLVCSVGVMRFLQIEWHNHERARNSWDIEKAEMKQKITKMQGENNQLKRNVQVLEKHVKMLENAIQGERRKAKAALAGEKPSGEVKEEEIDFDAKAALKKEIQEGLLLPCSVYIHEAKR